MIAALLLSSCGDEMGPDPGPQFLPQTSPENVLANLQTSYIERSIVEYGKLLGPDFQFYFDEGTRQQNSNLPIFWDANTDSAETGRLFDAPQITDIRILLPHGPPSPSSEGGERGNWWHIFVPDTFLEVDLAPASGDPEGTTFRVDGQQQVFYFRKGKTPEDTDSETWYLVEWRDYGRDGCRVSGLPAAGTPTVNPVCEPTTWSAIKSSY